MGPPSMSVTVPRITTRSPSSGSTSIVSPRPRWGEPGTKNGPSTVFSVLPSTPSWVTISTSDDTPSVSDRRMNSWRVGVAHLAGGGEELDAGEPLVALQAHLFDEGVEVADGRLGDLPQARVGRVLVARQHVRQQLGVGLLRHGVPSLRQPQRRPAAGRQSAAARDAPSAPGRCRRSGCGRPRGRRPGWPGRGRRGRTARSAARRRRVAATAASVGTRRLTTSGREAERQLVDEQHRRARRQRLGQHHHLLLAARQRRGPSSPCGGCSSGNSSRAYSMPLSASPLASEYVATRRLSATVSSGRSRRPSGTTATPARRIFSGRRLVRSWSPSRTAPGGGPQHAGHGQHQRRLAGAVRTEQRRDLAGGDLERDVAQHRRGPPRGTRQPLDAQRSVTSPRSSVPM